MQCATCLFTWCVSLEIHYYHNSQNQMGALVYTPMTTKLYGINLNRGTTSYSESRFVSCTNNRLQRRLSKIATRAARCARRVMRCVTRASCIQTTAVLAAPRARRHCSTVRVSGLIYDAIITIQIVYGSNARARQRRTLCLIVLHKK